MDESSQPSKPLQDHTPLTHSCAHERHRLFEGDAVRNENAIIGVADDIIRHFTVCSSACPVFIFAESDIVYGFTTDTVVTLMTIKQDCGTLAGYSFSRLLGCASHSHNYPNRLMRRYQRQRKLVHPFPNLVTVSDLVQERCHQEEISCANHLLDMAEASSIDIAEQVILPRLRYWNIADFILVFELQL